MFTPFFGRRCRDLKLLVFASKAKCAGSQLQKSLKLFRARTHKELQLLFWGGESYSTLSPKVSTPDRTHSQTRNETAEQRTEKPL